MTVTYKDIRTWGTANGYKCRTGKLGQNVVAAYAAAFPDAVIADVPEPMDPASQPDDDAPAFTVTVDIAGHDDAAAEISQHLVNAIYAAFEAGRSSERAAMLAQLGGTA